MPGIVFRPGTARESSARSPAMSIHYPKRTSKIKRRRQFGFLGRMKTKSGRALLNKRRRIGRKLNTI